MGNLTNMGLYELSIHEKIKINAGGIHPIIWMTAFHIAKEAYNDWNAHVEAFNEGRNSVQ